VPVRIVSVLLSCQSPSTAAARPVRANRRRSPK